MRRLIKVFYALIFIIIQFSALQAQQVVEGIVAVIGKEIVLKSEVDYYLRNYALQNNINLSRDQDKALKFKLQIIDKMVEQKILLTKADQDTIIVEERDVDQRVEQHIKYLINQVGSEEKLEEAFQNPIKKIRRNLVKDTEEQLKIDMLKRNKFMNIKVSRREVENFYRTFKDSIPGLKETVNISHILKVIKPGQSSEENALKTIMEIEQMLKEGADFQELAKKYSQDPASAKRGGDLGFTNRGDFVREFEEVAFELEPDQISEIVKTQFGFHIIQLIERRGEKINTRHILIMVQPTENDEKYIVEELKSLRQQIVDGADFSEIAKNNSDDENVGIDNGNLGTFETQNLSVPAFAKIVDLLEPGDISLPFKTEFGYHIVKLNSRTAARTLDLKSDWDKIQEMALNHKIEDEYQEWIEKLKEDIPIKINAEI